MPTAPRSADPADDEIELAFDAWRAQVDRIVTRAVGLGVDDCADWASWDAWESGATPAEGAIEWAEAQDDLPDEVWELLGS